MLNYLWFFLAALFEIAGCFAFWMWLRQGKSAWWIVPALLSLTLFAVLLTRVEAVYAGRAYAAYGGIYIIASIGWLAVVERIVPRFGLDRRGIVRDRGQRHPVRSALYRA
jgi:small multidrug resistance family-3 protein